jgi:hypothetical protein
LRFFRENSARREGAILFRKIAFSMKIERVVPGEASYLAAKLLLLIDKKYYDFRNTRISTRNFPR